MDAFCSHTIVIHFHHSCTYVCTIVQHHWSPTHPHTVNVCHLTLIACPASLVILQLVNAHKAKHPAIRGLRTIHLCFDWTQLLWVFDQRGVPSIGLHLVVILHFQEQHTATTVHQINEAIDSSTCVLKINLPVKINANLWWVLTMRYSPDEGVQGIDYLLGILHNVTPILIVRNSIVVD